MMRTISVLCWFSFCFRGSLRSGEVNVYRFDCFNSDFRFRVDRLIVSKCNNIVVE